MVNQSGCFVIYSWTVSCVVTLLVRDTGVFCVQKTDICNTKCLTCLAWFKLSIQSGHEGCTPEITSLLNFGMLVSKLIKQLIQFPVNKLGSVGINPKFVGQEVFLMPSLKLNCASLPQGKFGLQSMWVPDRWRGRCRLCFLDLWFSNSWVDLNCAFDKQISTNCVSADNMSVKYRPCAIGTADLLSLRNWAW